MHIKDKIAEEMYDAWELDSKEKGDILQALAEAYMRGVRVGSETDSDSELVTEANDLYPELVTGCNKVIRVQFKDWDCKLVKSKYYNGRTALELVAWQDDEANEVFEGEPIATCTVNMPNIELKENEVIIKDYSENEGLLATLLDHNVIKLTERVVDTGWVTCHICELIEKV